MNVCPAGRSLLLFVIQQIPHNVLAQHPAWEHLLSCRAMVTNLEYRWVPEYVPHHELRLRLRVKPLRFEGDRVILKIDLQFLTLVAVGERVDLRSGFRGNNSGHNR